MNSPRASTKEVAALPTPGTWKVSGDTAIVSEDGTVIGWVKVFDGVSINQAQANARLIAAAPSLLAHLEFAVTLFMSMPLISGTAQVHAMRDAIAKARGESEQANSNNPRTP